MSFGAELKRLRKERNVSQQELADNIYVSRSAIAKWENGLGLPSEDNITKLMEYFKVPRENFFPKIEEEEVVKTNKDSRKKTIIMRLVALSIFVIFVTVIFLFNLLIHKVPEAFSSDRTMMIDGYYVFIEECKFLKFQEGEDTFGITVFTPKLEKETKEEHNVEYEINMLDNLTITNRFLFFSGFEKVEYEILYLGDYDQENNLVCAGFLYKIKDKKGSFHYFYNGSILGVRLSIKNTENNRQFIVNGVSMNIENDYYFTSNVDLSDSNVEFVFNGTKVDIFTEHPSYLQRWWSE